MTWQTILGIAGGIVLLGNALERLIWAWNKAHQPEVSQNERLTALEGRVTALEGEKDGFLIQLKEMMEASRISQEAILALLGHDIDGNNVQQMQTAKDKLTHYLINH